MADTLLQIVIKARDESAAAIKAVNSTLGDMEAKASKAGASLASFGGKLAGPIKTGGLIAAAGIGAASLALGDMVKDAAQEQIGIERLNTAIKTLGDAHRGSAADVETVIAAREKLSFSDDDLRDSLSQLIASTGDYQEALDRQALAMDVARGTGLDLATASRLVGKITDESVTAFQRYGINIDKNATQTEALAAIQAKFAGQSEAYANTAAGKWQLLGIQFQDIKESIGAALLPTVTQLGAKLSDFLTRHQGDIDRFSKALSEKIPDAIDAIGEAFEKARPALESIGETMKEGFEVIQPALEWVVNNKVALTAAFLAIGAAALLAFTPVTVPILAVVAAIGGAIYITGLLKQHWQDIRKTTLDAWGSIPGPVQDALVLMKSYVVTQFEIIRNEVETAVNVIRDIIDIATAIWRGDWGEAWDGMKALVGDVLDGIVTDITLKLGFLRDVFTFGWGIIAGIAETAWEGLRSTVSGAIDDIVGFVEAAPGRIEDFIGDMAIAAIGLGSAFRDGIVGGIKGGFGALGDISEQLWEGLKSVLNSAIDAINDFIPNSIGYGWASIDLPNNPIPHLASGTSNFMGGVALVGERGPELAFLPRGTAVLPAGQTAQILAGASSPSSPAIDVAESSAGLRPIQNFYIDRVELHGDPVAGLVALGASA